MKYDYLKDFVYTTLSPGSEGLDSLSQHRRFYVVAHYIHNSDSQGVWHTTLHVWRSKPYLKTEGKMETEFLDAWDSFSRNIENGEIEGTPFVSIAPALNIPDAYKDDLKLYKEI